MKPRRRSVLKEGDTTAVDALLEACQPLSVLPPVVHTRVKRRLRRSMAGWNRGRVRWLKPAVVTMALLLCGVASGLALDRIVLRSSNTTNVTAAISAPAGERPRASKASTRRGPPPSPAPEAEASASPMEIRPVSPLPALSAPVEDKPLPAPVRTPGRRLAMPSPVPTAQPVSMPSRPPPAAPGLAPAKTTNPAPSPEPVVAPPPSEAALLSPPAKPVAALAPAAIAFPPASAMAPARPSPPQADGPSEERMLATAVRALRSQGDARSALATLDEYGTRFPQGRLSVEAGALRASALLALDRREEALRVLDALDLAHVPGGAERQAQRAELRVGAGRAREAIADFDAVLGRTRDGDLAERALWGRAQARLASGDRTGAQADAVLYLRSHPTGRFVGPAAGLAGESP